MNCFPIENLELRIKTQVLRIENWELQIVVLKEEEGIYDMNRFKFISNVTRPCAPQVCGRCQANKTKSCQNEIAQLTGKALKWHHRWNSVEKLSNSADFALHLYLYLFLCTVYVCVCEVFFLGFRRIRSRLRVRKTKCQMPNYCVPEYRFWWCLSFATSKHQQNVGQASTGQDTTVFTSFCTRLMYVVHDVF